FEQNPVNEGEITLKTIESRKILQMDYKAKDRLEVIYSVIELENLLNEKAPVVATSRYGLILDKDNLLNNIFSFPSYVFITLRESNTVEMERIEVVPERKYACIR